MLINKLAKLYLIISTLAALSALFFFLHQALIIKQPWLWSQFFHHETFTILFFILSLTFFLLALLMLLIRIYYKLGKQININEVSQHD